MDYCSKCGAYIPSWSFCSILCLKCRREEYPEGEDE